MRDSIRLVNGIRKANPALQSNDRLTFHGTDNDRIVAYSKTDPSGENMILITINLNPHESEGGWVRLSSGTFGIHEDDSYFVRDLLTGARYSWKGIQNFVLLNPVETPGHVLLVERA